MLGMATSLGERKLSIQIGTYASMLPQKKTNFPERFRKESEYAETSS